MRLNASIDQPLTRLAVWLATTSLALGAPLDAGAQPPPPSAAGEELAGQPNTDPPPVAGSLAAIAGSVSFHAAGETQWSPATLNYPVTNGEGFWTEPQASATINVADNRVVLDESTEFDVGALDQSQFTATEAQGAIFVQLNSLTPGQTLVVNTPRGSVQISQAGEYEIVAGDTNDATTITVVQGAAHVSGTNVALDIGPNQTAIITGSDTLQGSVGPLQEDAFLKMQLELAAQNQPRANVPRECRYMTGGAQLASYGSFTQTAQYGQVWYPSSVPTGWAPYRDGHWAYVSPWGWTWVDNARWGFAPFHYGRWAQIEGRWGWIPGGGATYVPDTYPIYSPALVSFVGVGAAGLGFSVGIGAGGYAPAWIPLGPREPYYPWYHARGDYFARINSYYGVPRTIIERGPTYINTVNIHETNFFINRAAATVVPPAAFARGQSVMAIARPVPERAFAEARPLGGRLPVTPTAFTPNLPPEAARRFNVPVPARPVHVAAGPRILPLPQGSHHVPELRRAALPQNVHGVPAQSRPGVEPGRPDQARLRPGAPPPAGAPALRPGETARPGLPALRQGEASRAGTLPRGTEARPAEEKRPGEPALRRPEAAARPAAPATRPELRGPGAVYAEPGREAVHPEARPAAIPHVDSREPARPETRTAPHEAAPHVERPPVARPEARPAVRPEPARPAAARPEPRPVEHATARPEERAPARPEPPREAPHAEQRHAEPAHAAPPHAAHKEEKHEPHH